MAKLNGQHILRILLKNSVVSAILLEKLHIILFVNGFFCLQEENLSFTQYFLAIRKKEVCQNLSALDL